MVKVNAGRLEQNEDGVRLIMTEEGGTVYSLAPCYALIGQGGTRMSSTRYVHYGRINFVLRMSSFPFDKRADSDRGVAMGWGSLCCHHHVGCERRNRLGELCT
jgi:hypothetical protein